jgi:ABC-type glycerol-3-phosphate transport system substrate-binding protein
MGAGQPRWGRRWRRAYVLLALALAGLLAACSSGSDDKGGSATQGTEKVTLTLDTFGEFGYEDLIKQYQASHPNITVNQRKVVRLEDYRARLDQWLAAGSGAGDVVALEEGQIIAQKAQADKYVNLLDYGAGELKSNFLEWKWNQGLSADQQQLIGLGTDIGPLAMAYRTDLFKKAGLPTARDEVSKLWPTWDAYIEAGRKFKAANTGAKFFDSLTNVYNTILNQQGDFSYFDTSNNLVIDTNPRVKTAWDLSTRMYAEGLSASLRTFDPAWNAGFKKDAFATVAAPAWMLGIIQEQSGASKKGLWDVAAVPGGGGNWGGSFLAVPTQSKHPREAADLAKFLTSPESQAAAFKAKKTFPSSPTAQNDPAVQGLEEPYFNNAPIGQIFAQGAQALKPLYLGPKHQPVREKVDDDLRAVEQGKLSAEEGWQRAVADAKKEAD